MSRHFGILVPSTNTTCEIEFGRLPDGLQAHAARLGKGGSSPFSPSLDTDVAYQSKLLGDARVEVIALAQTSASLFADDYDAVTVERMTTASGQPSMGMAVGSMRMAGFQSGRLAEFSINEMAMTIPGVPLVKIGHLSLAGLDLARIMRTTAAVGSAGRSASAEQSMALISALEGFEVRDYDVPDFKSGKFLGRIDALKATWGKFSNGLPTITRLTMKAQLPIDDSQPALLLLKSLGRDRVTVSYDIGTTWNEATQALTTAPLTMALEGLGELSGSIVLNSASRQPMALDAARMMAAFQAMDIGSVTLKVRDGGGTKAYAASGANPANALVDAKARLMAAPVPNVGAITILDAASRFLDTPGQTVTMTLTPKSKVSVSQFSGPAMAVDGGAALLDLFTVEATVEK